MFPCLIVGVQCTLGVRQENGRPVREGLEGGLVMVSFARDTLRADQLPSGVALRHADPGPSTVIRAAALRRATGAAPVAVAGTLAALAAFLTRHVILPEPRTADWLAAWVLATWCSRSFRVFLYLSIRSAEKRCGKRRLLGLLARLSFNASPVSAHPTEAQVCRTAARTGGAQFFDEVASLRDDRERFDALVTVLNVGFERGGVVSRLEHRDGRLVEQPYEVYTPRVLAGIAGLKDTLDDRARPVLMLRKRRAEPVARLGRATEHEARELRDAGGLACLAHIGAILASYDAAPVLLEEQGIDDRAVDLWSPLIAIALAADEEGGGEHGQRILAAARDLAAQRDAESDMGPTAPRLEVLEVVRAEPGERLAPAELVMARAGRPGWEGVQTPRRLATLLAPLGITRRQVRMGGRRRWCYLLEAGQLAELRARYTGEG